MWLSQQGQEGGDRQGCWLMCQGVLGQGGRGLAGFVGRNGGSPEPGLGPCLSSFCPVLGMVGLWFYQHQAPDLCQASDHPGTVADPSLSPGEAEKSSAVLTRGTLPPQC